MHEAIKLKFLPEIENDFSRKHGDRSGKQKKHTNRLKGWRASEKPLRILNSCCGNEIAEVS